MSSNNDAASRIVAMMREEGANKNGFDMTQAVVTSVNPVGISYNNVNISSGVVLAGCMQTATALEEAVDDEAGLSQSFKDGLKELIKSMKLEVGDSVAVQRVKDTFYIVGKVN